MEHVDYLSASDTRRLQELGVVFESAEGGLLTQTTEGSFELFNAIDGAVLKDSTFSFTTYFSESELGRAYLRHRRNKYLNLCNSFKMSPALSAYFWVSKEDDDQIEFRSPVPDFPLPGQLTVVSSKNERRKKRGGEYCLAACDDGTVRWPHESECVINGNHVWTAHLFDLRGGGTVYFGDRLQRPAQNYSITVINKIIGGNVNVSGTQNIGTVSCG